MATTISACYSPSATSSSARSIARPRIAAVARSPVAARAARRQACWQVRAQQQSSAEQKVSEDDLHEAVHCTVTENGALICERIVPGNYIVSKIEDAAEMKGRGGMMLSWFLEGVETGSHCTVSEDGRLVCTGLEPGVYEISEMPDHEEDGHEDDMHGEVVTQIVVEADGSTTIKPITFSDN